MAIESICENLYRILIPFEDIYTTSYVAVHDQKAAIIDSGACAEDVDQHILPALEEIGVQKTDVQYLLLTHSHSDHAGGTLRLTELFPSAEVRAACEIPFLKYSRLADHEMLLEHLQVIYLPGHTRDSIGFLVTTAGTLLSGDCLQLAGISKYRNNITDREAYDRSIEKLQGMKLQRIVAAHAFEPLGSIAEGEEAVQEYLEMCKKL